MSTNSNSNSEQKENNVPKLRAELLRETSKVVDGSSGIIDVLIVRAPKKAANKMNDVADNIDSKVSSSSSTPSFWSVLKALAITKAKEKIQKMEEKEENSQ